MMRTSWGITGVAVLLAASWVAADVLPSVESAAPGVWKVTWGTPEAHTPVSVLAPSPRTAALGALPEAAEPPLPTEAFRFRTNARGLVIDIPMTPSEQIFGLGLHPTLFNCTDTRKEMVVNDHQEDGDGSSHAPAPFYVSTRGYGVFVDTARYARFYCGNLAPVAENAAATAGGPADNTEELYRHRALSAKTMTVEVPVAKGADVYLFAGPDMKTAVRRYNLFSGGGCLPPLWGLGVYYRGHTKFSAAEVLSTAKLIRDSGMPCDVFGLEPGWHTHAYSCTYVWSPERWPDPDGFIREMRGMGYELNLWEHAFVHPDSPLRAPLLPLSGDYEVWKGLVPDFSLPEARALFADYHERELVRKGVTGFKLDECDNQPNKKDPWSFPELSKFPSGMDGEQMHGLFGSLYQKTLLEVFDRNQIRTYGKVRSSHALAAPLPFVLYSDYYDHAGFVRALANSGFCGHLWQPEVRNCASVADLIRRTQTAVFSPQTVIDSWFLKLPPWLQIDTDKNNAGELMPDHEAVTARVRALLEMRMRLVPYLYGAFLDYHRTGTPPFRAVVMDYPDDKNTHTMDTAYMMGPSLLVAPLFGEATTRKLWLPKGDWFDFWTGEPFEGGKEHDLTANTDTLPVFVKAGSLIPLADPVSHITKETVFQLEVRAYGAPPASFELPEDDGVSTLPADGNIATVRLDWPRKGKPRMIRTGDAPARRYEIREWLRFDKQG